MNSHRTFQQLLRGRVSICAAMSLFTSFAFAESVDDALHDALVIPTFIEQQYESGIDHQYTGSWEFVVGGGGAAFDCNGDRMPDVFLAGGSSPAALYENVSATGGALRFKAVELSLSEPDSNSITGAYALHLDNDEHLDLVILRKGRNLLLKGDGTCGFTKVNRRFNFDGGRAWTTGFAAIWEKGSNYPALAFGNYIDQSAPGAPWGTCHNNELVRSETAVRSAINAVENSDSDISDDSTKLPSYSNALALSPGYCSLSLLFTDWNNTGEPSLRITNDRQYYRGGQEQLWQIPAQQNPKLYSKRDGWKRLTIWGMGIAEADLNADGFPEYALSSMGDNMLQQLDPEAEEDQPIYRDVAFDLGTTAHRPYEGDDSKPSTGWHVEFADFNNDARTDLFIAKGNVSSMPDFAAVDPDNLLLQHPNKRFVEAGAAAQINMATQGRGALVSDFNADGQLDLIVVNREAQVGVFRNLGLQQTWGHAPLGNWVAIELQQREQNRQAIGARVIVKTGNVTQSKTVSVGGGHAAGSNGFLHVGLGVAERAVVRVRWPDGNWSHEYRVFANHHVVLRRDDKDAVYWYPK